MGRMPDPTADSAPADAASPADTPLGDVVRALGTEGYDGQFIAAAEERVLCTACRSLIAADHLRADQVTRLEGASDPADMVMVVPLTCPVCATTGTLVLHYGAEVTEAEELVTVAMQRAPGEGPIPDPTPGITPSTTEVP